MRSHKTCSHSHSWTGDTWRILCQLKINNWRYLFSYIHTCLDYFFIFSFFFKVPSMPTTSASISQYQMPMQQIQKQENLSDTQTSSLVASPFNDFLQPSVDQLPSTVTQYVQHALDQSQPPSYPSVIAKTTAKSVKNVSRGKTQNLVYSKSLDNVYSGYGSPAMDRLCKYLKY